MQRHVTCFRELRPAISLVVLFTLLTGFLLPGLFTGAMQIACPARPMARCSRKNGQIVGSALIGQNFTAQKYFQPRPSALRHPL